MRKKLIATALTIVLILPTMLFPLSGCSSTPVMAETLDLMAGINPRNISIELDITQGSEAAIDFAVRLFQYSLSPEESSLISPLSVLCALAMTANGADGNTKAQMEEALGFSVAELNGYLYLYIKSLAENNGCEFHLANSIWFRDVDWLKVEEDFLQLNADYYGAEIYKAPFNDDTLKSINQWVSDNTRGMIDSILDRIDPNDIMHLINALAFEAEWQTVYTESQIRDGIFTSKSGDKRDVKMMYSEESVYLDDGSATGFIKYYTGGRYAFAALLPNEGISIDDYISTLTGPGLADTLRNAQSTKISVAIPRFEGEYKIEMSDILKNMGIIDAFSDYLADFTKLSSASIGNIYIDGVLHKTFISVDEKGTKAGAGGGVLVTVVSPMRYVYLNRPFVYILLDCDTNLPFFIGTVLDL